MGLSSSKTILFDFNSDLIGLGFATKSPLSYSIIEKLSMKLNSQKAYINVENEYAVLLFIHEKMKENPAFHKTFRI
jgi:hypothetical protein